MSTQELTYWQQQAQAEQEQALDASPDPDYDLDDAIDAWLEELTAYWFGSRL